MIVREFIEFKRGASSDREVKEKLLGWRSGQILIIKDKDTAFRRLMAFSGIEESFGPDKDWSIKCLEIGHISGDPMLVYIHFGFTENILIKRKPDLRIPTEEEAIVIEKAMKKPDYQKYIEKAEQKIGAKLFV